MDIDISKLSKKARKRLDMYIYRSSKYNLIFLFCLLLLVFLPALGAELGSFIGGKNSFWLFFGLMIGFILMVVFSTIISTKITNNSITQFIQKFGEMKNFPICFECKQNLKDYEQDNCPNCGADIRIHFISDEEISSAPVKLRDFNRKEIKDSISWLIYMIPIYIIFLTIVLLIFQCFYLSSMKESKDKYSTTIMAISDFDSGYIRFFEAKPNDGYCYDQKTDKIKNGIPIYCKYYSTFQKLDPWLYPFIPSDKDDALCFVKNYNNEMRWLLKHGNRPVILSEKNGVSYKLFGDDCFHIKLDSKFIYNDYVSFSGKETGRGFIKDIVISGDGNIFYNIQAEKSGAIKSRIKQDEIKLIKRQSKDDQIP